MNPSEESKLKRMHKVDFYQSRKKIEMVQLITNLEVDFTHSILSLLRLQLASWHQAWLLNLDHGELWYHPYLSG